MRFPSPDRAELHRPVAVVGGAVKQGMVVSGDHNEVSFQITGSITYDYSDVAPSSVNPGELEEAHRRLEELPL